MTSSAGRLFDAIASIAGVRDKVSYEGQAAIELEWLASNTSADGSYPFELVNQNGTIVIDTRPLIRAAVGNAESGVSPPKIARRLHTTIVEIIKMVCEEIRSTNGHSDVVLSGGVFMNALLTREVNDALCQNGFHVYRHRQAPPNDGGLSLGQLAIAAATLLSPTNQKADLPCA